MRGIVSDKLKPFLEQVNEAIAAAKADNIGFEVETTRQNLNNLSALLGDGPDIRQVADRYINHGDHKLEARVYHPAPEQPLPVIMHYHGGGHMCGSVELYDTISRYLADICHCIVIAVEYRLSPEFPYPIGLDDCAYALKHKQEFLKDLRYSERTIIVGDSAGGAICSSLAMRSQSDKALRIDKQVLIYPSVDYTMTSESFFENGNGFLLEKEKVVWYFEQYFQGKTSLEQLKLASPLHGEMSNLLPETLVFTAGCDPLRDEGQQYVKALDDAGVKVNHIQFDGMIHAYMLLHTLVEDECLNTYHHIRDFIHR